MHTTQMISIPHLKAMSLGIAGAGRQWRAPSKERGRGKGLWLPHHSTRRDQALTVPHTVSLLQICPLSNCLVAFFGGCLARADRQMPQQQAHIKENTRQFIIPIPFSTKSLMLQTVVPKLYRLGANHSEHSPVSCDLIK